MEIEVKDHLNRGVQVRTVEVNGRTLLHMSGPQGVMTFDRVGYEQLFSIWEQLHPAVLSVPAKHGADPTPGPLEVPAAHLPPDVEVKEQGVFSKLFGGGRE